MLNHHSVPGTTGRFHVAEIAEQAHVSPATVRYYSRIGLLKPGRKEENGYRCYSTDDLHRLVFVRQAQKLGLTIGDIKSILESFAIGDVPCLQVKSLVEKRLISIRAQIVDLRATQTRMIQAMRNWDGLNDSIPFDGDRCPQIKRLDEETRCLTAVEIQKCLTCKLVAGGGLG